MLTNERITEILSNAEPSNPETSTKILKIEKTMNIKNGSGNITIISGSTLIAVISMLLLLFFWY